MKQFAILILLTLTFLFSKAQSPAYGDDSLSTLLDNYVTSANKAYKLNGCVLIAQKGKILLHKAYGPNNVSTQLSNDTFTRFPILSLTKSFTATAILKLQEEGKLSIKNKLSKYFPDYQYGDRVTIEQLLTHSSGINNYTDAVVKKIHLLSIILSQRQQF
jgi:CubicO group peptidase (beta-lactamase class C family)